MQLGGLLSQIRNEVVAVDVDMLSSADAARLVEMIAPTIRQLIALRDSCAARTAKGSSWVAEQLDVSQQDARRTLAVQSQLTHLPHVRHAVRQGNISSEKAAVIARASNGDEQVASDLLVSASSSSFEQLRRTV
jgi:hypothetical protein